MWWHKFLIHVDVEVFQVSKGLKATNEQQDDGAGILHQVAQFPIDQVFFEFLFFFLGDFIENNSSCSYPGTVHVNLFI